ncbi:E3 ubiquitin-protein ligase TRIM39-like [Pelodiscus sinensis]|uniref:E3 ubiquitin-protein ligase TRIM39-like n=1 Tax=Pelodiscus sinensis TaxID=13735 RepID=UPI003F6BCA61
MKLKYWTVQFKTGLLATLGRAVNGPEEQIPFHVGQGPSERPHSFTFRFCPSPSFRLLFLLLPQCQHKPAPGRADTRPTAMASTATAGELQEEATCPICLGYLTEPVTVACGHNFCRACLTQHCEQQGAKTPPACPQCRAPFQKGQFNPNTQLSNIVQKLQQLGPQPGAGRTEGLCERHQERLKLFCQEDGAAICLVCEKSRDHKSHTVVPVEEAAQEYKEKLQGALGPLRKQLEEARALTSKEEKKTTEWQRKVQAKREMIAGEFNKLHTLLREEEQLLLQRLAEEERETLQRLQEKVTKLSQQSASLQQLIAEIEGKCQQPVLELLKHVEQCPIFTALIFLGGPCNDPRSENMKLPGPEPICTDLRNGYRMCLDLREALNRFAVDVTLDPDTANPKLVLSEDRKCVRHGNRRQDLPDTPERFDPCINVLGAEGFAGGRCYWEVEVGDKTGWTLGVCRESVSRKGNVTLTPGDGYWAVWLRNRGYKAGTSTPTPLPVSTKRSRVGIFLDYEVGKVSFYNVTDRSHLFTFTCTFSGTLRPFFCPGLNTGGTNAAPLSISVSNTKEKSLLT